MVLHDDDMINGCNEYENSKGIGPWVNGDDGYYYRDLFKLDGWTVVKIREIDTDNFYYSAYKDGDELNPMGYYDKISQVKNAIKGVSE